MTEHRRLSAYRAYIVRVWPSKTALKQPRSWRAQLVDVSTGESVAFSDPIKLAAYLYAEELLDGAEEDEDEEEKEENKNHKKS